MMIVLKICGKLKKTARALRSNMYIEKEEFAGDVSTCRRFKPDVSTELSQSRNLARGNA